MFLALAALNPGLYNGEPWHISSALRGILTKLNGEGFEVVFIAFYPIYIVNGTNSGGKNQLKNPAREPPSLKSAIAE
jgi:hypothetical protein